MEKRSGSLSLGKIPIITNIVLGVLSFYTAISQSVFNYTFTQLGTYQYYCTIHPWMKGTIVVTG